MAPLEGAGQQQQLEGQVWFEVLSLVQRAAVASFAIAQYFTSKESRPCMLEKMGHILQTEQEMLTMQ